MSFDCYGTLIDWESGILNVLNPWADKANVSITEESLLAGFAKFESAVQEENPGLEYRSVLKEVAVRLSKEVSGNECHDLVESLPLSIGNWPAFEDTVDALNRLSSRFQLVVLSNITEEAFQETNRKHLRTSFANVFTAQKIGSYKPDPNNFRYLISELDGRGILKDQINHVAQSLFHDIQPAGKMGLTTAWIKRPSGRSGFGATPQPTESVTADCEFDTLGEFADFVLA